MKSKIFFLSSLPLLTLMGCKDLPPFEATLQAPQQLNLMAEEGSQISVPAATETPVIVTSKGSAKRVEIAFGEQKVVFHKLRALSKEKFVARAQDSGVTTSDGRQVGLEATQTLVCDPECIDTKVNVTEEACVVEQCEMRSTACWPLYSGTWTIQRTYSVKRYDVKASLLDASGEELATLSGRARDVKIDTKQLTRCQ